MYTFRGQTVGASRHGWDGKRVSRWVVSVPVLVSALCALAMWQPVQAEVFHIPSGDVAALIAAINTANGNGEENTIHLEAGTYTLTVVDNTTEGANGLPSITSAFPLTLTGVGAESTIIERGSGAPDFRLLHVASTGTLLLEGLTFRGGAGGNAGGILNRGTLTLTHSTVANNAGGRMSFFPIRVLFPVGISNSGTATLTQSTVANNLGGDGAGISNSGTLTLTHSTVANNRCASGGEATCHGGGIANSGTLTLTHSTVANNSSFGFLGSGGGGISNRGTATLTHSTVANNSGDCGGGIDNVFRGTLTIINSTVANNTAGGGGGINNDGTLTIINSTLTDNQAQFFDGGGLSNTRVCQGGSVIGGIVALQNTILALNTGNNCVGAVTSLGNNLLDDLTGCTIALLPSDIIGAPGFGDFTDAGTPGAGHFPLLPTSPAIDAGNDAVCPATDQRGKPRPVDGNGDSIATCDIGAFEFLPLVNDLVELAADVDTTSDFTPVPGGLAGTFTITATFINRSPTPLRFLFFGVSELTGRNLLLNADAGPGGVGATLTPEVAGDVLAPGASVTVEFVIGLQVRERFTFLVDVFGEPGP